MKLQIADLQTAIAVGLVMRLLLTGIGAWLDRDDLGLGLRYTDIDYDVFNDAARAIYNGGSPYERPTYRYPPLLALLLVPNHILGSALWGKILFVLADTVLVKLVYDVVLERDLGLDKKVISAQKHALSWALVWALNPLSAVICTRGSSDAVTNALVLLTVRGVLRGRRRGSSKTLFVAGMTFGLAVHLRMYPIIYLLAFLLYLSVPQQQEYPSQVQSWPSRDAGLLTRPVLMFVCGTIIAICYFTVSSLVCSGDDYSEHAILYHLKRQDHRHNFSVRWYDVYLKKSAEIVCDTGVDTDTLSHEVGRIGAGNVDAVLALGGFALNAVSVTAQSFVPQAVLVTFAAIKLARRNLCVCLLVQTMLFVAFNAVVTAQYFTWYLCLIPLAIPERFSQQFMALTGNNGGNSKGNKKVCDVIVRKHTHIVIAAFVTVLSCMCLWLHFAYQLEMQGQAVHMQVWWCSVLFHVAQVGAALVAVYVLV